MKSKTAVKNASDRKVRANSELERSGLASGRHKKTKKGDVYDLTEDRTQRTQAKSRALPSKVRRERSSTEAPKEPALQVMDQPNQPAGTSRTADKIGLRATPSLSTGIVPVLVSIDVRETLGSVSLHGKGFHGGKFSEAANPPISADMFGYMTEPSVRKESRLRFNGPTIALLDELGEAMAGAKKPSEPRDRVKDDSTIPAGFTYLGQFIAHDILFDDSSSLDLPVDANTIPNLRTPALDLDAVYGGGPALQPLLYDFPVGAPTSAIKMRLGRNVPTVIGGPAGSAMREDAMKVQSNFDVPRVEIVTPNGTSHLALIGDPRNDENLVISQLHHAMLRFHNMVVDRLVTAGFPGDVFAEAKRTVTHHYQWAVVHDFLRRVCGKGLVDLALLIPAKKFFRMPVEFSAAAYRFGHSMVRDVYWINNGFDLESLDRIFEFIRDPNLPVHSGHVVDFNAFFQTGIGVPVFNMAKCIDTALAGAMGNLPGFAGMMAVLAKRNLRRGLALGLPSGQAMACSLNTEPLSKAELLKGLEPAQVAVLQSQRGLLLKKTPLWYYILREAAVAGLGNRLGPLGALIVALTFAQILKRDPTSYINSGFVPHLPCKNPPWFTFADLVTFAGVTEP